MKRPADPTTRAPALRAALLAVLAALGACTKDKGDDSADTAGEPAPPTPDALACAKTSEPGVSMVPGTAAAPTAPAIGALDTPVTIQLDPAKGGWIRVPLTKGEYTFWLGQSEIAVGLVVGTSARALPALRPNADCPDLIPEAFDLSMVTDDDVFFNVKPSIKPPMWAMVSGEPTVAAE
jgi:hypothetical protein